MINLLLSQLVYGWLNDSYSGEERYRSHILGIGFRKGREVLDINTDSLFDVISIDGDGLKGNKPTVNSIQLLLCDLHLGAKGNADYVVLTEVAILNQFVIVSFLEDLIALELNETFYLKLKPKHSTMPFRFNVLFCDTIKLEITDSDGKLTITVHECQCQQFVQTLKLTLWMKNFMPMKLN